MQEASISSNVGSRGYPGHQAKIRHGGSSWRRATSSSVWSAAARPPRRRRRARLRSATASYSACQLSRSPGTIHAAPWKYSLIAPPPSCVSPRARRNWCDIQGAPANAASHTARNAALDRSPLRQSASPRSPSRSSPFSVGPMMSAKRQPGKRLERAANCLNSGAHPEPEGGHDTKAEQLGRTEPARRRRAGGPCRREHPSRPYDPGHTVAGRRGPRRMLGKPDLKIENGRTLPSLTTLHRIADALQTTVGRLCATADPNNGVVGVVAWTWDAGAVAPAPAVVQAMRTEIGHPSFSIRLSAWTAVSGSSTVSG